jgi:WD40 repeat protein
VENNGLLVSVAFSTDSQTLASGSLNGTIYLWDIQAGRALSTTLRADNEMIREMTFSPDNQFLAAASFDSFTIWNIKTREKIQRIGFNCNEYIHYLQFSADGYSLETSAGVFKLKIRCVPNQPTSHSQLSVSAELNWLMWGKEKIVWLPIEYRPDTEASRVVAWNNSLAMVIPSDEIAFYVMDPIELPFCKKLRLLMIS